MKDIKNYEGLYAITEDGQVWSYRKQTFLKPITDRDGYKLITLRKPDTRDITFRIHRLVAQAYIPNPDNLPQINHKDEDKANNHVSNLEWCTHLYNMRYGTRNARRSETMRGKGKAVYCVELDKTFINVKSAYEATGATGISGCCRGKYKVSGGYHWRYV